MTGNNYITFCPLSTGYYYWAQHLQFPHKFRHPLHEVSSCVVAEAASSPWRSLLATATIALWSTISILSLRQHPQPLLLHVGKQRVKCLWPLSWHCICLGLHRCCYCYLQTEPRWKLRLDNWDRDFHSSSSLMNDFSRLVIRIQVLKSSFSLDKKKGMQINYMNIYYVGTNSNVLNANRVLGNRDRDS